MNDEVKTRNIWQNCDEHWRKLSMVEAVMRAQGYAIGMEHDMSRVFGCDRGGMAGKVNSDFIRRNSLAAVLMTCGYIYGLVNDSGKKKIEKFIDETSFYWEINLDELLSFETSSKVVGISTVEIDYENGEKAVIDITNKFSDICNLIKE